MSELALKEKEDVGIGHDKYLEFTISGSYYNSKKEIVDFDNVTGKIPLCDEDNGVGSMHVRGRFARKWVKEAVDKNGDLRYPERINKLRQVHIDNIKQAFGTYSFIGKNIKELNVDEMQELAVAKDLRFIPLPEDGLDLRDMRVRSYVAYSEKVLRKTIKWQAEDFNFAKLPALILDGNLRCEEGLKISNEEIIEREANNSKPTEYGQKDNPADRFTLAELKSIADEKNIEYDQSLSDDDLFRALYSKLFSA
jgi:hypothetical protein